MADSKKRTAGNQLTRDNPDPDEEQPEPEMGSFQKATDEVMAKRRIVKVKRTQQQTANLPNPFAGIRLAPPVTVEKGKEETEKKENGNENDSVCEIGEKSGKVEGKEVEGSVDEGTVNPNLEGSKNEENPSLGNVKNKTEIENETKKRDDSVTEIGEKSEKTEAEDVKGAAGSVSTKTLNPNLENVENKTENESKNGNEEAPVQTLNPLSSFGQLSSGQNAFSGLASIGTGTGFSSFGTGTSDFSNSVPIFGSKTDSALKVVPVETGEENDKTVFNADAALFEYLEGGWKERGKGEVKLNVQIKEKNKARLVMRTKGNYRLVLNASLYADMALKDMDKKGVTFACVNSAGEKELGLGLATFALKFRDGGVRDEFKEVVSAHKRDKERETEEARENVEAAVLKAPGNSPKETEV